MSGSQPDSTKIPPKGLKWTTDRAKKESEQAVFKELLKKSPQRWGELLKNTKLSSRTLKNALDRMQKKEMIRREIEQGREYPPPVLYSLSPNAKALNDQWLLENFVRQNIFRTKKDEITLNASKKKPRFVDVPLEKPATQLVRRLLPEIADDKERLSAIGRRLGAFYLFALLKSIEEGNYDSMPEAKSLLDYDYILEAALGFGIPEQKYIKLQLTRMDQPNRELIEDLTVNTSPLSIPSKEKIQKTIELLKQAFPEEREFLTSVEHFKVFSKEFIKPYSEKQAQP